MTAQRFEPERAMIEGERAYVLALPGFDRTLDRTTRRPSAEPMHEPCPCCGARCRHCTYPRHDHSDAGDCPRRLTLFDTELTR